MADKSSVNTRVKDAKPSIPYTFPLQSAESVYFRAAGAVIDKAALEVGGRVLSIIVPQYGGEEWPTEPQEVALNFFGDMPFHGALAPIDTVKITLHVSDGCTPSLILAVLTHSATWDTIGDSIYKEKVRAGSDKGDIDKVLVYVKNCGVGYISA